MAESAAPQRLISVEDYLELEKSATVRHEYVAGEIHAMTGASKRHNRIITNILRRLADAAAGGPCRVYTETVKLRVAEDVFYYPDVMVACGEEPDDPYLEDAPCLIVEVTSSSTGTIDRREKLAAYKGISSLNAYLIVDQEETKVERRWRDEQGLWWHAELSRRGTVPIPCPETELTLEQIYEGL